MPPQRPVSFMDNLKIHDPQFFETVSKVMSQAEGPGALDAKTKALMIVALDSAGGSPQGAKHAAARARSLGATKAEITEAVRLAFVVAGVPGLVAGLAALEENLPGPMP